MRRTLLLTAVVFAVAVAPAAAAAPYENPKLPVSKRVDDLLSRMSLEEKVGQMTQTERYQFEPDANNPGRNEAPITELGLGSVLSGGGSTPAAGNTPQAWADMVDKFQRAALKTRLKIPLLYGVDSVHGHGNLLGATVFPHNIGLGATRDPDLVRRDRQDHRRGDARERPAVDVLALHLRRPRRPLGPHLRVVQRERAARRALRDRDRRLPGRRRARHRQALRG